MNINIEIFNEYESWNFDMENIKKIAIELFKFLMSDIEIKQDFALKNYEYTTISFDILFCDGKKTHQINRDFRNKDYPADIITFALFADSEEEDRIVQEFEINLGEVIIALDKIETSANEKNIDKNIELYFMISHGIMHLLGFDHQSEEDFDFVVKKQKQALESIGIKYDKI